MNTISTKNKIKTGDGKIQKSRPKDISLSVGEKNMAQECAQEIKASKKLIIGRQRCGI